MAEGTTDTTTEAAPEVWVNATRGKHGVVRLSPSGEEKGIDLIRGKARFTISKAERIATQQKIRKPENDPFRNGSFVAVSVDSDDPELQKILKDPNSISDKEIADLFEGRLNALESRLAKIDSATVLKRLLAVANDEGASTRRVQAIRERLDQVQAPVTAGAPAARGEDPWYPGSGKEPDGGQTARVG